MTDTLKGQERAEVAMRTPLDGQLKVMGTHFKWPPIHNTLSPFTCVSYLLVTREFAIASGVPVVPEKTKNKQTEKDRRRSRNKVLVHSKECAH